MARKVCARCNRNEDQHDVELVLPPPPPIGFVPATKLMCNVCVKELGNLGVIKYFYPGFEEGMKTQKQKHPNHFMGLSENEIARGLASLRYSSLTRFFNCLARHLRADGEADEKRGRKALALLLRNIATNLESSGRLCEKAWEICARYMPEEEDDEG
jgi:hypothetical protein